MEVIEHKTAASKRAFWNDWALGLRLHGRYYPAVRGRLYRIPTRLSYNG